MGAPAIITDPLSGENDNRLFTGLLVVSILLHGIFIFQLSDKYRPQRTSYIELTMEEIPRPARQVPSAPVRMKEKEPPSPQPITRRQTPPVIKPAPKVKTIAKANPAPVIKPTPIPEPAEEVEATPPPQKLEATSQSDSPLAKPESIIQPALPPRSDVPVVETRVVQAREAPTISENENEEAATTEASAAIRPSPDDKLVSRYLASVRARIERNKRYPLVARRRGLEGEVGLRFSLGTDGNVVDLEVIKSSGVDRLDQAALAAVQRATPFAKPPEGFIDEPMPLELTVVFELD